MEPKWKQCSVVDVTGDRNNVQCSKEQYCIGTWNIRSMNQGKLEVVKQEIARVNIDNLGTSELKRTGMGKFSSDEHYIHYSGQESLRRNGVALIVSKRVWNVVLEFLFRQTIQYHSNPSLCPNHQCWSWSWMVLWWSARPSRNNTKKRCLFITGNWSAKLGSQEIPGVTGKFGLGVQNEAG